MDSVNDLALVYKRYKCLSKHYINVEVALSVGDAAGICDDVQL